MASPLHLLHVDEELVVAVKPAGLPAVPGRAEGLQDCLWSRVRDRVPEARVVHRLDMATSGLMLFARGAAAESALSRAFAARQVDKHYEAWVLGTVGACGRIELPIAADWPNRPRRRVCALTGKAALTLWQRLDVDTAAARTRLRLQPVTGRTHQLRVHLAATGHPIVGDALYGGDAVPVHDTAPARLLLHATRLAFAHPRHGARMSFESPAPF